MEEQLDRLMQQLQDLEECRCFVVKFISPIQIILKLDSNYRICVPKKRKKKHHLDS